VQSSVKEGGTRVATIYDIAREAGVSIATVSKVINQTGRISDKTRKHVQDVMKRIDYQPSVVASALTKKRTYSLGLLIPDIANPFFAELARSIEDHAHELGYSLVICSTDNDLTREERYVNVLRQKSADGIIIATGARNDTMMKQLMKYKLPVAVIAREMPLLAVDTVLVDDYLGGYLAASHLTGLGHRNIAVIAEDLAVMSSKERVRGYRKALEEAGITYDDNLVAVTAPIFGCNDLLAIGVVQAARELGLRVPEDVSVVGFDNTVLATIIDPPLTSVAQPVQQMGKEIVQLITGEIDGSKPSKQRLVLLPELVVRGTTSAV
ncbi:hypothetical protein BGX30_001921, partial [Mortierella sp. GBA39]